MNVVRQFSGALTLGWVPDGLIPKYHFDTELHILRYSHTLVDIVQLGTLLLKVLCFHGGSWHYSLSLSQHEETQKGLSTLVHFPAGLGIRILTFLSHTEGVFTPVVLEQITSTYKLFQAE